MKPRETVPHWFLMFELTVSSTTLHRCGKWKCTLEKEILQHDYNYSIRFREVISWTFISMYLLWIGKTFFFLSEGPNFIGNESKPFLQLQYFRQISLVWISWFSYGLSILISAWFCLLSLNSNIKQNITKSRTKISKD